MNCSHSFIHFFNYICMRHPTFLTLFVFLIQHSYFPHYGNAKTREAQHTWVVLAVILSNGSPTGTSGGTYSHTLTLGCYTQWYTSSRSTPPSHSFPHTETPFITDKMHPTTMHFTSEGSDKIVEWSSRRHRKGRNVIIRHQETGERITDSKQ